MPRRNLVVIGASAGGVEALTQVIQTLPEHFPAAICIVMHVSPHSTSALPQILGRAGALPVCHPSDGDEIRPGHIYVAPPDYHLLVSEDRVKLARGPRENGHRPAVDVLFRTAARGYGSQVIGVILSGSQDDGTAGLAAIKARGGVAIVQDPQDAAFPGMPRHAIENVEVDHVLPLSLIGPALLELAGQEVGESPAAPADMGIEADMAELELSALQNDRRPGTASGFTCPQCHGSLFELHDAGFARFRCRVGHAYSAETLMSEQSDALEAALYIALRTLRESAALARQVADRARSRSRELVVQRFEEQAREAERGAAIIRQVLLQGKGTAPPDLDPAAPQEGHVLSATGG